MRRLGLFLAGLIAGLALVGCAGDDEAATPTTTETTTETSRPPIQPHGGWVTTDLGRTVFWDFRRDHSLHLGTFPPSINERGQVVGYADTRAKLKWIGSVVHAFLWDSGEMRDLTPGSDRHLTQTGLWLDKVAINNRGQVVGEVNAQAFLYEGEELIGITTKRSEAVAINDHGRVVGWVLNPLLAVVWQRGQVRELGTLGGAFSEPMAINERGQVVGRSGTRSGRIHAFLWQDGKMRDLGTLGGRRSVALGINGRGQVVGWADIRATDKNGKPIAHAVLWQNGTMIDLGTLGGQSSAAVAINDHGQIVGLSTSANGEQHAVLWTLRG